MGSGEVIITQRVARPQWLLSVQRLLRPTSVLALLLWIMLVAGSGVLLALRSMGASINGEALRTRINPSDLNAVLLITLGCLGTALLTRRLRAAATLPATIAIGGLVIVAAAIGTGTEVALLVVVALFALAWLLGEALWPGYRRLRTSWSCACLSRLA